MEPDYVLERVNEFSFHHFMIHGERVQGVRHVVGAPTVDSALESITFTARSKNMPDGTLIEYKVEWDDIGKCHLVSCWLPNKNVT